MVNLFSRVLRLDSDGFYYLVTPVEKIRIIVEDKPFIIIDFEILGSGEQQIINFKTNTHETFSLNLDHPLRVEVNKETLEPSPYVLVRKNLEGLISRNIYYKLIDLGEEKGADFGVVSQQSFFKLYSKTWDKFSGLLASTKIHVEPLSIETSTFNVPIVTPFI